MNPRKVHVVTVTAKDGRQVRIEVDDGEFQSDEEELLTEEVQVLLDYLDKRASLQPHE